MGPHAALRKLETLLRSSDLPSGAVLEAEDCLSVLWKYVLIGSRENDDAGVQRPGT